MKLVFVHGWASGPFVWDSMRDELKDYDCTHINLGFFDQESISIPDGKFIGIGHSLGGLWLLKHYPERLSGFVSIASFNCFYRFVPKQILSGMQKNIAKDMMKELSAFWSHAGLKDPKRIKDIHSLKLIEGLNWLSKWETEIPKDIPIKILAAKDDLIVTDKMTNGNWGKQDIRWIDRGGHMLPLTQAKWCSNHIKEFLNEFNT